MIKELTNWSMFHINVLWRVEILKKNLALRSAKNPFKPSVVTHLEPQEAQLRGSSPYRAFKGNLRYLSVM